MNDTSSIDSATQRLALALDTLEAAVERRLDADLGEKALAAQVHVIGSDRSRLAAELDEAAARSRRIEAANREIAHRLDAVIDTVRSVLEASDRR